jgi:hypothetical protein
MGWDISDGERDGSLPEITWDGPMPEPHARRQPVWRPWYLAHFTDHDMLPRQTDKAGPCPDVSEWTTKAPVVVVSSA